MKKIIAWFIASITVLVCLLIGVWSFLIKPVTDTASEYAEKIRIPSGMLIKNATEELRQKKVIRSKTALYLAIKYNLFSSKEKFVLRSGVYTVKSSMSLKEIYFLLQSGVQEYITVSIPEGLTMTKIASILEEQGVCKIEDFLYSCKDKNLLNEYNIPAENFEGYLFPDTYFFTPEMEGKKIIISMVNNFYKKIDQIPQLKKADPKKIFDILTLASIVEREYRVAEEAPLIASVFTNRIKRNIGLYSCATVEYIITEIEGRPHPETITYKDLKIDNPYNTYKWAGLTPGPISNPGMIALNAAANPPETKYFYFVLTDPSTGRHTFSKDFSQHIEAENSYYTKPSAGK